jgi:hypothetical protein
LSIHTRPALVGIFCACATVCLVSTSRAFTLHHIAATLDLNRLAAATPRDPSVTPFEVAHPVVPAVVELTSQSTEIEVRMPAECDVEIQVVDESGLRVCGARVHMPAGTQKVAFSGHDAQGRALPNGVYYYSVVTGDVVSTTRVTITR